MAQWLKRLAALTALIASALTLSGCYQATDALARALMDSETIERAETVLGHLLARDQDALRDVIHADAQAAFTDEGLAAVLAYLPETPVADIRIARADRSSFSSLGEETTHRYNLVFRVDFEADDSGAARSEFVLIGLFARGDAELQLAQVNIFPAPGPVYGGVSGWPAGFWAGVILAPLAALLCLLALISVWRTPRLKRRILWSVFIVLIGYPVFTFSTTTGAWILQSPAIHTSDTSFSLDLIRVTVMSAGWVVDMISGQHVFQLALPMGALAFFLQKARGKLALKAKPESPAPAAPAPAAPETKT